MMSLAGLDGLDLADCAGVLDCTPRELVALAERIPGFREVLALGTAGGLVRTKRWIAAGCPSADLSRLEFAGDDEVRALVVEVLTRVPSPVAWHGVEFIAWAEVGRSAHGWQGLAPMTRCPPGDQPHMIALSGLNSNDVLRGVIAHELAHSWTSATHSIAPRIVRMSQREQTARRIAAARVIGQTSEQLIREQVAGERIADRLARLWSFERHTHDGALTRLIAAEHAAAADLADSIERDLDIIHLATA